MAPRPAVTPAWGGTQVEPSSGQKSAGFAPGDRPPAQWFNWIFDNFADWVNYLDTEKLTDVVLTSANTSVFGTTSKAEDHPSSPSNAWKQVLSAPTNDDTFIRLLVGAGNTGAWAITWNAAWNPGSGAQNWSRDQISLRSTILWCDGITLRWEAKAAGAGTWTSWDLSAPVSVDELGVIGALTAATIASGSIVSSGSITVTGGGNVLIGGEIQYPSATAVRKKLDLAHLPTVTLGTSTQLANGDIAVVGINASAGAVLGQVRVLGDSSDAGVNIYLKRVHGGSMATALPVVPTTTTVDSTSLTYLGVSSNGACDWGGLVVSETEQYRVILENTGPDPLILHAIDVEIAYPVHKPY